MEMMTLTQLAQLTDLAPPTVRRYLDDYILYVPSVRVDGAIGFPPEAVTVMRTIHSLSQAGHSHTEITERLGEIYPVTVISSQALEEGQSVPPMAPAIASLLRDVDSRYRAVYEALASLRDELGRFSTDHRVQQIQQLISSATATTFQHFDALSGVPAELTQIKQAIGVLATRLERATTTTTQDHQALTTALDTIAAQVAASISLPTSGMAALRAEVAEIRHNLNAQAIEASVATAEALRPELETLKHQVAELRQERGQMLSLMSTMQETLLEVQGELAEARQRSQTIAHGTARLGHGAPHLMAVPQQATGTEPVPGAEDLTPAAERDKMRTPRRLGHITGRS